MTNKNILRLRGDRLKQIGRRGEMVKSIEKKDKNILSSRKIKIKKSWRCFPVIMLALL